jgi:dienelactone hydrolase
MKNTASLLITLLTLAFTAQAQLKSIAYTDGAQKLNGLAAAPAKPLKNKPGVLILHAWMGIDENAKGAAERLSALGYYTFIADTYGEGNYPADRKSAGERSSYFKNHTAEYQQRIRLAMNELIKSGATAGNIVVIGYCFGGTGALEAARANLQVKGVVTFHGGLGRDTSRAIQPIQPKVLVCHGADDPYVPAEQVKAFQDEMRKSRADWQMIYYSDAVHAFTEKAAGNDPSKGAAYNEAADKRSWEHLLTFLKDLLQ